MMIIDTELKKRAAAGKPVMVGMAGAGFMGRGIANQIANYLPGMKLAAVFSRNVENALKACLDAGMGNVVAVETLACLHEVIRRGGCAVTNNADLLPQADELEGLIDATGAIEFGARFASSAIRNGKHLVLMNAELDATVGPILKKHADRAGVIITGCDGDQPGVQLNLVRFVRSIGLTPLVCGNIKALQDRYRNPTTQAGFAKKWGQTPEMVTSFADGTKISFEQAIVANATGMCVAQRGMLGYEHARHVDELTGRYDLEMLKSCGGIVDYVVGSKPSPGVFVFAARNDDRQRIYLDYGKLGEGPLYSFYVPYHLTVFEVPLSVARVVLLKDVIIAPVAGPRVDVVATAKIDLKAGDVLDGIGGYRTYGLCENADKTIADGLLPMGLAEGCRVKGAISRDQVIRYADVELPGGRVVERLRSEQDEQFFGPRITPMERLENGTARVLDIQTQNSTKQELPNADEIVAGDLENICARLESEFRAMQGKRLFISGGAGFLGHYLIQSVLHWNRTRAGMAAIHVTVCDNFMRGIPDWLSKLSGNPALTLLKQDITVPLPAEAGDFDFVIHAASIASPPFYRKHPIATMDANVNGLRLLLDRCQAQQANGCAVSGFLFFSTSEIYGDPPPDQIPTAETYRGNVSCNGPRACYDESKRFGETLCVNFARELCLPISIVRPFNNYGPGLKMTDRRVIPDFARDLFAGNDLVIFSDGSPTRTFCYVADAIVGYFKALVRGRSGESYNIGNERPEISISVLAELLAQIAREQFGYAGKVVHKASPEKNYLEDNPQRRCPLITKARVELGFNPEISLEEGLRRTLAWYRDNRETMEA